jgi:4,5-dihydroxyphthalate decarboxylase
MPRCQARLRPSTHLERRNLRRTSARVMREPLRTLLGDYPTTRAVRQRTLTSPHVPLAFADVTVPNKAFKRVVRDLELDVAELALMTFLMARSRGVPLRLLPVVVFSRNPLPLLVCDAERGRLRPRDLAGRRIAVRAYATTTAVWVRAMLADAFGVDLARTEWLTLEEGHVAGVDDPPTVRRAPAGADVLSMLRAGVVDAAIVDPVPADPRFASVVPDPENACREWQNRHGARTLNHVITLRESLAHDVDAMRELFRLFRASREMGGAAAESMSPPVGLEAIRSSLEAAIAVTAAQGLLARPLTVDDLVTDVIASL